MGLIEFIVLVLIVGVLVYLINTYAPIDAKFKTLITWAAILVLVVILIRALGLLNFNIPLKIV